VTTLHRPQDAARVALKVGRGLAAFRAGLDEFFHLLADWRGYCSPPAPAVVPVSPRVFMPGPVGKAPNTLCGRTLGRVFR
jgi:hypothetical protein